MIQTIQSFSEVVREPNALYVFDIDETLFTIPWEYWHSVNDCRCDPITLDSENLQMLIREIKETSRIILLTSRHESLRPITESQLQKIGFTYNEIYFDPCKGRKLMEILSTDDTFVIFVDDLLSNVTDVHQSLSALSSSIQIFAYQIVHSLVS